MWSDGAWIVFDWICIWFWSGTHIINTPPYHMCACVCRRWGFHFGTKTSSTCFCIHDKRLTAHISARDIAGLCVRVCVSVQPVVQLNYTKYLCTSTIARSRAIAFSRAHCLNFLDRFCSFLCESCRFSCTGAHTHANCVCTSPCIAKSNMYVLFPRERARARVCVCIYVCASAFWFEPEQHLPQQARMPHTN